VSAVTSRTLLACPLSIKPFAIPSPYTKPEQTAFISNAGTFNPIFCAIIDAVDGVISLAWEKFDFDNEFERLTFKFGEPIESVTKKLKNRNYSLLNEEIKIKEL
jgi:hypothetical protein